MHCAYLHCVFKCISVPKILGYIPEILHSKSYFCIYV